MTNHSKGAAKADVALQIPQGWRTTPATQPRWNPEGFAFATGLPVNEGCLAGTVPVYRAYNDGFRLAKDSNHRFTTDANAIQSVMARGWIYARAMLLRNSLEFFIQVMRLPVIPIG